MPFPTPNHQRLDVLTGIWDTTITLLEADGRDGAVSQATDAYRWISDGHFLLHDVEASMGGTSFRSVEIIAVDAASGQYATRSYDADGSINDFTASLNGRDWRIVGAVQRFAGRFSADGRSLSGQWEQKQGETWSPLMMVSLRKRAGD